MLTVRRADVRQVGRLPGLIGVMADRIESPFHFSPVCHVWTKSKTPGSVISDGLPQHDENMAG
jgi:hypothetical protein